MPARKSADRCPTCGQTVRRVACATCGKRFIAKRADAKYCSVRCRVAAHRGKPADKGSRKG